MIHTFEEFINEAKEPLMKVKLGIYAPFYDIKPRATTKEEVTPKAKYAVPVINCGMNCSQYTLKTRFGYSVLDMLDEGKLSLFFVDPRSCLFGTRESLNIDDHILLVDNDSYTKQYETRIIKDIVNTREEYLKYLKKNGFQVYPPKAFTKPSGRVSDFAIRSIKGVIDCEAYLNKF